MKKRLLLAGLLFGTFLTSNAQEIFTVDFEDETALADWYLINADGDNFGWGIQPTNETIEGNGFSGSVAASASFDNTAGPLTPDNSLITQMFTVPSNGANVSYKVGGIDPEFFSENYAVYVVTDEAFTTVFEGLSATPPTAEIADYTALLTNPIIEEVVPTVTATTRNLNIPASFQGQNVRLVFRHFNVTDQFFIVIDDVAVNGGTAGVNNVLASTFSVYPNPASNVINVGGTDALVNNVSIADLNGRTVKTAKFNGVANAEVNVADLSAGVYMMTVASDKGTVTKKIVKN